MATERADEQRQAADPNHSAWVSAHAGSGKTFVLIDRLVRLLLNGVEAEKILCITFTKAAASEMSARLYERLSAWTLCDEESLRAELTMLEGKAPNAEKIKCARGLFIQLLEGQTKSHIQTIHSFCQSVLRRFPIEADIYPNFKTIDEYQKNALLKQTRLSILTDTQNLAEAIQVVAQNITLATFDKIFAEIITNRKKMTSLIEGYPAKLRDLEKSWGLQGNLAPEEIRKGVLDARPEDMKEAFPHITFDDYKKKFITNDGGRRKNIKTLPAAEQERIFLLLEKANQAQSLQFTRAFLQITEHFLKKFERVKKQKGMLDYDDLIYKTLDLFQTREAADWVLYRLDGGIDHILIDEAQDTNPEQWQLIEKLSEEFFAGLSYKENPCTLFVVGDAKQSIFGFQGAAPDGFAKQKALFAHRVEKTQKKLLDIPLATSFRAAPRLLTFIDEVLRHLTLEGVEEVKTPHTAHRDETPGLVEVWELEETAKNESPPADEILADKIAVKIAALLQGGIISKDILILLRRRNRFFDLLARSLKSQGVSVAGSDRLKLDEELPVLDLLSLAKWVLLPQDDLALAEVLKSPLCLFSEAQLMDLALGRGKKSLWEALCQRAEDKKETDIFYQAVQFLTRCLRRADFISVFDFFSEVLEADNARANFVQRLGVEVCDPLDAFLNLALTFEQTHTSTLQNFITWFSNTQADIKRDMERGHAVRLMTIHSAKGMESKVVFFVDIPPRTKPQYFEPIKDNPFFRLRELKFSALEEIVEKRKEFESLEEARLLYVALTRARDQLYICGYKNSGDSPPRWLEKLQAQYQALPKGDAAPPAPAPIAAAPTPTPTPSVVEPLALLPKQTFIVKNVKRALNPSLLMAHTTPKQRAVFSPLANSPRTASSPAAPAEAALRGTILHEALRYGTKLNQADLTHLLNHKFSQHPDCSALATLALSLIANKDFKDIFHPPAPILALDEAPVQAQLAGVSFAGKIDRLLLDEAKKLAVVIDYKSDAKPPALNAIPEPYQRQLASYRLMLVAIYPAWQVRCAVLWTATPRLDWLSEAALEKQQKVIISSIIT